MIAEEDNMLRFIFALLLSGCAFTCTAQAQDSYPNRPIRLVVPYPAGGTADAMARALGQEITAAWNQPVVVENRPGANTIIGAENVARSEPDGYTILFTTDSTLTINPSLQKRLSYDPQKDFAPITVLGYQDLVLVSHPSVPVRTLDEFVVYAKTNPGKLNYGSFGNGSPPHLAMEMFRQLAGISLVHVPAKGIAQVLTDLLSGTVQTSFVGVSAAGLIRDGKVTGLAMGGAQRSALFGEVPTFAEKGYGQMYARAWWGLVAPAGTPREIVAKLNKGVNGIIGEPQFRAKRMAPLGLDPVGGTPEAFAELIRDDTKRWANVIEQAGIKPE
jgi:tripartite-type tricarboxylate transporter receptor subunit TctC